MIVCNRCGTHNAGDATFCIQCGSFLEWEGTRIEEPAPEPQPEPVVELEDQSEAEAEASRRAGLVQRVKAAVRGEGYGTATPLQESPPVTEGGAPGNGHGAGGYGQPGEEDQGLIILDEPAAAQPAGEGHQELQEESQEEGSGRQEGTRQRAQAPDVVAAEREAGVLGLGAAITGAGPSAPAGEQTPGGNGTDWVEQLLADEGPGEARRDEAAPSTGTETDYKPQLEVESSSGPEPGSEAGDAGQLAGVEEPARAEGRAGAPEPAGAEPEPAGAEGRAGAPEPAGAEPEPAGAEPEPAAGPGTVGGALAAEKPEAGEEAAVPAASPVLGATADPHATPPFGVAMATAAAYGLGREQAERAPEEHSSPGEPAVQPAPAEAGEKPPGGPSPAVGSAGPQTAQDQAHAPVGEAAATDAAATQSGDAGSHEANVPAPEEAPVKPAAPALGASAAAAAQAAAASRAARARSLAVKPAPAPSRPAAPAPQKPGAAPAGGTAATRSPAGVNPATTQTPGGQGPGAAVRPGAPVAPAAQKPGAPAGADQEPEEPKPIQPAAQQPSAVKPAMARERPIPTVAAPAEIPVAKPGDIVCERCSYPNDPSRQYCRRCGLELHTQVEVKLRWWRRWWQRFIDWLHRNRNEYPDDETATEAEDSEAEAGAAAGAGAAGGAAAAAKGGAGKAKGAAAKGKGALGKGKKDLGRGRKDTRGPGRGLPRQGSRPRQLTAGAGKVLPIVALGLIIALAVAPGFRKSATNGITHAANAVRRLIDPTYTLDKPVTVSATSQQPQEPAQNAFDEIQGTPWETDAPDNGIGQSITAGFGSRAVTVDQIIFTIGTGLPASYESEPRPQQVQVILTGARGVIAKQTFTLSDTIKPQNETIHGKDVTSATVTILSVYPSTQGHNCAIDEIEFFQKD